LLVLPKTYYQDGDNYLNIPLNNFDNGFYFLEFITSTEVRTRKLLIQK